MDINKIILNRKPNKYDYRDYRLSSFITERMRKESNRFLQRNWFIKSILDQGNTPHCVGYAWGNFGISLPVFDDWDNTYGDKIYYKAKEIDGEPMEENGSTTRSGVKAFTYFGKLSTYAFVTSFDDLTTWLLTKGPVITGTYWYTGMFYPNSNGLVTVTGKVEGGHEWMISGINTKQELLTCTNSWGTDWGDNGQFLISFDDYKRLLSEQGDACTAFEISASPQPQPNTDSEILKRLARALKVASDDLLKEK